MNPMTAPRSTRWQTAKGRWWRSCDVCLRFAWDEELSGHPDCPGPHKQIAITCPSISARPLMHTFAKVDDDHLVLELSTEDLAALAAWLPSDVEVIR